MCRFFCAVLLRYGNLDWSLMAEKGAQPGNSNAAKGKPWADAIRRALAHRSLREQREALDELAEKFLAACDNGDLAAFKELGDRLDGKPHQTTDTNLTGKLDLTAVEQRIVDVKD